MSTLDDKLAHAARVAAASPNPAKTGGEMAYILGKAAWIRTNGSEEQIELAKLATAELRDGGRIKTLEQMCRVLDEISGHEGLRL